MNDSNKAEISADLYSDGAKAATVKVPATDSFPDQAILSFKGKIFVLREQLTASDDGQLPTIYDEVTPYAVSAS